MSTRLPLGLPREAVEDFWEHSWRSYSRTLRRVVIGHPAVPGSRAAHGAVHPAVRRAGQGRLPRPLSALLRHNSRLTHVEVTGSHHLPARQPDRVAAVLRRVLAQTSVPELDG